MLYLFPKYKLFLLNRGLGAVLGVCLPEGVTDDVMTIKSIMYWQVSYKEEELIEVDSVAAVSNSDYMNTFYRNGRLVAHCHYL